jgi:glutamyl-tRNA reductase
MSPSPVLFLLGASHRTTPLELREKLALSPERLPVFHAAAAALPGLRELAVLNTCNRVEFYGCADSPAAIQNLREAFCAFQQLPAEVFASISRQAEGLDAIDHLLSVAAGLDSQMLGETEILGQIKTAYATAQGLKTTGPVLNRLFQKIFQHAKYVRTHSAITEGQISVANVAVELALKIFGELENTRILLLGAGDIGEKTAKAFQSRGAASLTIASRTHGRAMELATTLNATALPWEHVGTHLADFSIVVGSTSAPDVVVTLAQTAAAMDKRRAEPLFFIDLALPRDIDPAVTELDNVFLYNLDDLAKIAEANLAARAAKVSHARELVTEKAAALWAQLER